MLYFTDWISGPDIKYLYGWSMTGVVVLILFVNLAVILYIGFRRIGLLLLRTKNRTINWFKKKCFKEDLDSSSSSSEVEIAQV